jgi:hypothetical protein
LASVPTGAASAEWFPVLRAKKCAV